MRKFGFHLSIAGGLDKALQKARQLEINTLQIFLKNSNRWIAKPYSDEQITDFFREREQFANLNIFAHSAYLINLAAAEGEVWDKSVLALVDEIKRADILQIPWIVIHPGSHKGLGEGWGIKRAAESLDIAFEMSGNSRAGVLLETTAGLGNNLGYRFEHLRDILALSKNRHRLGICFDTCHLFAAGFELRLQPDFNQMIASFNDIIGLEKLKLIHLNDSKFDLAARKDRHEHIGKGYIGEEGMRLIINCPEFADIPFIMETPGDKTQKDELYCDYINLKKVYSLLE